MPNRINPVLNLPKPGQAAYIYRDRRIHPFGVIIYSDICFIFTITKLSKKRKTQGRGLDSYQNLHFDT